MKRKQSPVVAVLALLAGTAWLSAVPVADSADYVTAPVQLHAKDLLDKKLLKGENYSIDDTVQNDGLINTYQLTTDYGPVTVEGTEELMDRITELNAMSVMEEMDRKKVFGDSVVAGVKAPVQGAVNLVKHPVDTTKNIVKGTGKFFSNLGRSIVSDDPYQDNALKVALGYDATKRGYAYELHIDPYSSYEPVISMLGKVAQASVAGGLLPRAAMGAVDSTVTKVARLSGTAEGMRKLVRDNAPGELRKINASKLTEMGIPPSLAEALLDNHIYTPQVVTLMIGELEQLKGVAGRDEFVAAAALASEQSVALLYSTAARMLAEYHANVSPLDRISRAGGTPLARRKDGTMVVLLPLDLVFRTAEVEAKLKRLDGAIAKTGGTAGKEFWLTGRVDESARPMFEASGWKVTEHADAKLMKP